MTLNASEEAERKHGGVSASSWTFLAKKKESNWWSVELEGEMEKLEVAGLLSGIHGGSVDPARKMGHWSARLKTAREGSEEPKGAEIEKQEKKMEVYVAPHEARAEVQSPTRRVTRVELEITQDHVRETLAISKEEADEMGFVPSVLSEPRRAICWCDNRCSEKATRASMVIEEGGEARALNLCGLCSNANLVQQGEQPVKLWEWKEVVEKKAHRGGLWKLSGCEQFLRRMWSTSLF